jgi:amino acid transporter
MLLVVSVRVPAKITKYATITEIAVVFGLTLLLFVVGALRGNLVGSSLLFSHQGLPSKGYFSFGGLKTVGAFWVAITVVFFGAGTTGWQNAASAVEEGAHPARSAPRAMYRTVIIATVLETLFLIAFVLNISPRDLAQIASSPTSLADVMSSVLGVAVAKILLAFVGFNILTCALMLYYQTTRYVYAMARDGNFIGSKTLQLSRVHRSLRTPVNATLLVVVLLAIILGYFGTRPDAYINLITAASLSLVAVYLAGVVLFAVRGHSLTPLVPERLNALGRVVRWMVVAVAVVWLLFILWTFHSAEFKSVWVYFGGICGAGALFVAFSMAGRARRPKVSEIGIDGPSL